MPRAGGGHSSHSSSSHRSSGHRTHVSHSSSSKRPKTTSSHTNRGGATHRNNSIHRPNPAPSSHPMHTPIRYAAPPPPPVYAPPPRRHYHFHPRRRYCSSNNTTVIYDTHSTSTVSSSFLFAISMIIVVIIGIIIIGCTARPKESSKNLDNYSNDYSISYSDDSYQSPTTILKKTKLSSSLCYETEYYSEKNDKLGYFNDDVLPGLKYFYHKTGVQPYIMTEDISKVNKYDDKKLEELYLDLFDDEGHFLLVIFGDKKGTCDWEYSWCTGYDAETVIDDDALEAIFWYIDEYYETNMTDNELISNAFKDAADDIIK